MPLTKVSSGVIAANAVVDSFGTQSITGDKLGLTAINANNIVNASITGAKIALGTITGDDIATGQITGNLLTANCVSGNNIVSGLALTGNVSVTGNVTVGAGTVANPAISVVGDTNTGIFFSAADTIDFAEGGTATGQFDSSGNFRFNSGYGSVATAYGCRAWVNFNGTGTVAIRASGNVTSITDNGTGDYTVNFPAMPDANYTAVANSDTTNSSSPQGMAINFSPVINNNIAPTSTALRVACMVLGSGAGFDNSYINVAVFR